jgi:thymidylate synthase (FAD)
MKATLLTHSPMAVTVQAIRTCYSSQGKSDSISLNGEYILGVRDKNLVQQIIKSGHMSTVEHLVYSFNLERFPRFILQELSRHRIASPSVQSTRYTLSELKKEKSFKWTELGEPVSYHDYDRARNYLWLSGEVILDEYAVDWLEDFRCMINGDYGKVFSNDQLKQLLLESYLCDEILTINARSLHNLFTLRRSNRAHPVFQELAGMMFDALPENHKFIYDGCVDNG